MSLHGSPIIEHETLDEDDAYAAAEVDHERSADTSKAVAGAMRIDQGES